VLATNLPDPDMPSDPFVQLAVIGGALDPAACARAARAVVAERLPAHLPEHPPEHPSEHPPEHPFDAAVRIKRTLAGW
jgi:hypothetical protein